MSKYKKLPKQSVNSEPQNRHDLSVKPWRALVTYFELITKVDINKLER